MCEKEKIAGKKRQCRLFCIGLRGVEKNSSDGNRIDSFKRSTGSGKTGWGDLGGV